MIKSILEWFNNLNVTIQAAIIGAIIAGIFSIIVALITRSKKKDPTIEIKLPEQPPIETPPNEKKSTSPDVIPKLPAPYLAHPYPMQKNFTGRMAERMELTEWYTNRPEPRFAYIAIGGMGKSALTWY